MGVEWYNVYNFVMFSVVEICVDYGGVSCCFYLCIVYCVGIYINICGVVCLCC